MKNDLFYYYLGFTLPIAIVLFALIKEVRSDTYPYIMDSGSCSVSYIENAALMSLHCFRPVGEHEIDLVWLDDHVYPDSTPLCESLPRVGEIVYSEGYPAQFDSVNLRKAEHKVVLVTRELVITQGDLYSGESGGMMRRESGCAYGIIQSSALIESSGHGGAVPLLWLGE